MTLLDTALDVFAHIPREQFDATDYSEEEVDQVSQEIGVRFAHNLGFEDGDIAFSSNAASVAIGWQMGFLTAIKDMEWKAS